MPRNDKLPNTDEKLKCIKLAREQLLLVQARADWEKQCRLQYPGTQDWELRQNEYYKELLHDLDNAKYQTLVFELRSLIVVQKLKRKAAKKRAKANEAKLEMVRN